MSHSAISMAPMAELRIGPPRANSLRNMSCHRRSMLKADWPTATRWASCWIAASTARGWNSQVPSPTPWMPSSVNTWANTQLVHLAPTT
jgi:hypothetical protein